MSEVTSVNIPMFMEEEESSSLEVMIPTSFHTRYLNFRCSGEEATWNASCSSGPA